MRRSTPPLRIKKLNAKTIGERLWWMDPKEPRFRSSGWAKLAYAIVWAAGLLFLLWISQMILQLFVLRG